MAGQADFHLPVGSAVGFEAGLANARRYSSLKAPTMLSKCSFCLEPNQPMRAGVRDLGGSERPRSQTAAFQLHARDPGPWPQVLPGASHFIKCS